MNRFGKWVTSIIFGVARPHNATGEPATKAKVQRLVKRFGSIADTDDYWYLLRKPPLLAPLIHL